MMYAEMKSCILQGLLDAGWYPVDDISMQCTSAVAKKDFESAVGVKTAVAYFTDSPEECCHLNGEFFSVGGNALAATSFYVWYRPQPTTPVTVCVANHLFKLRGEVMREDLVECAKVYSEMAEKLITESFAVRLLNMRKQADSCEFTAWQVSDSNSYGRNNPA